MVQVFAEGVDYSRTPTSNWSALASALKAHGKSFVGRYAVTDKSPSGRGITSAEYQAMTDAGIEVFLYWEASEAWMLGGFSAGQRAADNAMANILTTGMPEHMPVYYSHDIEPQAQHVAAVNDCLRGAASVVGFDRVGLYGGIGIIDACAESETAKWFAQTYAWSGKRLSPAAHIHQYNNYGNVIGGVDVDLCAAVKEHYGQASDFINPPEPEPIYPSEPIPAPDQYLAQGHVLTPLETRRYLCIQGGRFRTSPNRKAPTVKKAPYQAGRPYLFDYVTTVEKEDWFVSKRGSWALARNFKKS